MALVDLTTIPVDIISSTAVSRGVESRLVMVDFSKNTWSGGLNRIYELPAGAAMLTGHWWIHTILAGGTSFQFNNGAVLGPIFTATAEGVGGTYGAEAGIDSDVAATAGLYSSAVNDLELNTVGTYTSGKLVIEINWRDIGSAVTAGYRKGDGTV
jgi:hypothetical protein